MKKVFVPLNTQIPFYKQFPTERLVWGDYEFVLGGKCEECDFFVVLDTVDAPITVNCREGGLILFPMETKSIKRYPSSYLQQFDKSFCFQDYLLKQPNTKLSIPPFPWMLIYDFYAKDSSLYDQYDYFNLPIERVERLNKFCIFTSDKKMSKGHCDRLHFVEKITRALPDLIDVYGNGFKNVDVKFDVMSKYNYCIVIENDSVANYRTEKLADAILAGCLPLYYGDPNIYNMFSEQEVESINIFDINTCIKRLQEIVNARVYEGKGNELSNARKKTLFEWNTFAVITKCLDQVEVSDSFKEFTIMPLTETRLSHFKNRCKQLFYSKFPYTIVKHINL